MYVLCFNLMIIMITIYTLPNCEFCSKAKDYLIKRGIAYKEINLKKKENRQAREFWRGLEIELVPVIVKEIDDREYIFKEYNKENFIEKLEEFMNGYE